MDMLTLHYAPDNASLIIRLALEEAGRPYQTCLVDRQSHAQKSPAFKALNPAGRIPILETPDGPLFETAAILLYLSEDHPDLMPFDRPAKSDALKWLIYSATTLHPALITLFYTHRYGPADAIPQMRLRSITQVSHSLDLLDRACQGPYFMGSRPSLPDYFLGPLLRWCALYPKDRDGRFDLTSWPALHKMTQHLEQRPGILRATTAEGLGPTPFSAPSYSTPPEGTAT